jgi:RNA polymerase I-specific transcription initiation factor RRN3
VDQFNPKRTAGEGPPPTAQLRLWILALSHVISRLERPHSALVEAIVNMPWPTMDGTFVKSYTVFIGMLLSAKPEYLSLVLSKIAQGFTHR